MKGIKIYLLITFLFCIIASFVIIKADANDIRYKLESVVLFIQVAGLPVIAVNNGLQMVTRIKDGHENRHEEKANKSD